MTATVRAQLLARAGDDRPGLLFEDRAWTWDEVVRGSCQHAAAVASLLPPGRPPHVGLLLDNLPELLLVLGGAALAGQVVVGLNTTRRGAALVADVERADVQVVLTEPRHRALLDTDALDRLGVPVVDVTAADWRDRVQEHAGAPVPAAAPRAEDLLMLVFTSGTSGEPKAVNVTHAKVAGPGAVLAERFGLGPADTSYVAMPLFHSNAVMAGWAPALAAGATVALARRFSASGFLADVRRHGATYASYVGKPLTYVLATPERPDDADNPLRLVFGNEALERDIARFAERFGCQVVDSYSSTENAVIVRREPGMPPGSLGRPAPGVKVLDPVTMRETPDARFDEHGTLLNADEATGELVNTEGAGAFAGYYRDPAAEAERMRGGMYWSGDLAYRDADGWVWFAGRTADWLRVGGENLAAAPVERVLLRHPAVREAAVYALPDPAGGDLLVAALVVHDPGPGGAALDPAGLEAFLAAQPDLSPQAWPRHVRVLPDLPRTATTKVLKRALAAEGAVAGDGVLWTREERGRRYA